MAVQHAVDHVADRAAENQRQRPAEQALAGMTLQQEGDHQRGNNAERREQLALPAGFGCQESECRALVVDQGQVEEGGDRFRFGVGKGFCDRDLGDLVEQDDNCRYA